MHSGCEQCCNNNNNDVFVNKLDIIYSNDKKSTWKFEFKDIIYKCNKCIKCILTVFVKSI